MAHERIPPDPNRPGFNEDYRDPPQRLEEDLQIDPELAEGPASGGRIALFAICIALVLGAVFYGLNNSSINEASTKPPAQTAQTQPASPPPAQGARDATPKAKPDNGRRDQPADAAGIGSGGTGGRSFGGAEAVTSPRA
jgi:hypothetical protein